jgi:TRAP-type C4-dicarboxylate transport system permease large subunit
MCGTLYTSRRFRPFVGVGIANTTIEKVVKPLLPLFLAMIVSLLLITYIPSLSLWLPSLFDL